MSEIMADVDDPRADQGIVTPRLSLMFQWKEDRWGHTLFVGPPEDRIRLAWTEPLEGPDDSQNTEPLPPPVLQQLHFQRVDGDAVAMLVGQTTHHHFSASFRVIEEGTGRVRIDVDMADRRSGPALNYRAPVAWSYLVQRPKASLRRQGAKLASWIVEQPPGVLAAVAVSAGDPKARTHVLTGVPSPTKFPDKQTTYAQIIPTLVPGAATQRCRFYWIWEGG